MTGSAGGTALHASVTDGVLTIVLNHAPANAMDHAFVERMHEALERVESGRDVRAVLVRSDLSVFSLGGDIDMLESSGTALGPEFRVGIQELFSRVESLPVPVVACLNGHTMGGGLELALACDIRVVADDDSLRIGVPEVRLGLLPGAGGTQRLARLLGRARALDLLLSGRTLTPRQALEWGLVTEVIPPDELVAHVTRRAKEFAEGPTAAYAAIKDCVNVAVNDGLERGLQRERDRAVELMATRDAAEGLRAFLDKRPPRFTGV